MRKFNSIICEVIGSPGLKTTQIQAEMNWKPHRFNTNVQLTRLIGTLANDGEPPFIGISHHLKAFDAEMQEQLSCWKHY